MKIPLNYQVSSFDCATISLLNALSFLYEREEIPAELIKIIYLNTLDLPDGFNKIGQGGTSKDAIEKIVNLLNDYANKYKFNLICKILKNEEINQNNFSNYLNKNSILLIRCHQDVEHYVIITKIKNNFIYLFDPYYIKVKKYKDNDFKIILNKPFKYNRKVKTKRILEETKKDFSMGKIDSRQCVLISKI